MSMPFQIITTENTHGNNEADVFHVFKRSYLCHHVYCLRVTKLCLQQFSAECVYVCVCVCVCVHEFVCVCVCVCERVGNVLLGTALYVALKPRL